MNIRVILYAARRVAARLCCVSVCYELSRDLREALPERIPAPAGCYWLQLSRADQALLSRNFGFPAAVAFRHRLDSGDRGYIVCKGERIMHYSWLSDSGQGVVLIAPGDVYLYDSYTAPEAANAGFAMWCSLERLYAARAAGAANAVTVVPVLRAWSKKKNIRRLGFRIRNMMLYGNCCGRQWRIC